MQAGQGGSLCSNKPEAMIFYSFLALLLLAFTHIFVHLLKFSSIPRSKWLSFAGGLSVTYIFLEAFPELVEIQERINARELFGIPAIPELEVFLVALLGLVFFYGMENRSKKSFESDREPSEGQKKNYSVYRIHIFSFSLYNFVIAYLLLNREEQSLQKFLLYAVAMSFHLLVTDHSLEDHYRDKYRSRGRWILVASLVSGWLLSVFVSIPEVFIGILFSFIAGGVVMNVLKEELPRERNSNLWAFCVGILFYGSILLMI